MTEKQSNESRPSITAKCATLATAAAGLGTVAVGLGILIESTFAASLGAPMPLSSTVRHGLVGLVFLIYILTPIAVLAVPLWLVKSVMPMTQKAFLISAWLYLAICYVLMIVGSIALHYYFAMGDWMRLPFGPFNLVAVHYFYLPTSWISWVLFWLPSTLLVCAAILNINTLVRVKWLMPIAAICIFFGLLSLPVPYAIGVYPNIRRDIGGGSPMLAIIGTNTHGDILKDLHQRSNGLGREDLEKELERGALLVWHFGDAVVCSSISKNIHALHFVSLSRDDIYALTPVAFDIFVRHSHEIVAQPRLSWYFRGASDDLIRLDDLRDSTDNIRTDIEEASEKSRDSSDSQQK